MATQEEMQQQLLLATSTESIAALATDDSQPLISRVQLEGLVVLKIIKHCQENFPLTVMGQLLGMNMDETLEITNCYPFMTQSVNATETSESMAAFEVDQQQYQRDMMFYVREGKSLDRLSDLRPEWLNLSLVMFSSPVFDYFSPASD